MNEFCHCCTRSTLIFLRAGPWSEEYRRKDAMGSIDAGTCHPLQERHWLELKRHLFIQNNSHERVCAEAESVPTSAVIHLVVPLGMGRTGLWYGWARRARHKLTNSSAVWCCLVAGLALLATVVSGLSSQP